MSDTDFQMTLKPFLCIQVSQMSSPLKLTLKSLETENGTIDVKTGINEPFVSK